MCRQWLARWISYKSLARSRRRGAGSKTACRMHAGWRVDPRECGLPVPVRQAEILRDTTPNELAGWTCLDVGDKEGPLVLVLKSKVVRQGEATRQLVLGEPPEPPNRAEFAHPAGHRRPYWQEVNVCVVDTCATPGRERARAMLEQDWTLVFSRNAKTALLFEIAKFFDAALGGLAKLGKCTLGTMRQCPGMIGLMSGIKTKLSDSRRIFFRGWSQNPSRTERGELFSISSHKRHPPVEKKSNPVLIGSRLCRCGTVVQASNFP